MADYEESLQHRPALRVVIVLFTSASIKYFSEKQLQNLFKASPALTTIFFVVASIDI